MYERDQNIRINVTFLDILNIQYISDNYNAMYFVWHNNEAFKKIITVLQYITLESVKMLSILELFDQ